MADHTFLADIEAFLKRTSMAESALGRAAVNDWKLVRSVREGRRLWPETEAKVRTFMSTYRPDQPEQVAA